MTPKQITETLKTAIPNQFATLLVGRPGLGKTAILKGAAQSLGCRLVISHPATADQTDAKGLPFPDASRTKATFLPFGELGEVLEAKEPTVWFMDDLGQAPESVQAAFMPYLLERRCGPHVLPDCVSVVAATNSRADRAGVRGLLAPVKSRFTILDMEPDLDSWIDWALVSGIDPFVIAFVKSYSPAKTDGFDNALCASSVAQGMENEHNPRTIETASKWLAAGLPDALLQPVITGCTGPAWASAFLGWRSMMKSMVNVDQILTNPGGARLPVGTGEAFATVFALGMKASIGTFPRIAIYLDRLASNDLQEYAGLLLADCVRREGAITATPEYLRIVQGELGKTLLGRTGE